MVYLVLMYVFFVVLVVLKGYLKQLAKAKNPSNCQNVEESLFDSQDMKNILLSKLASHWE